MLQPVPGRGERFVHTIRRDQGDDHRHQDRRRRDERVDHEGDRGVAERQLLAPKDHARSDGEQDALGTQVEEKSDAERRPAAQRLHREHPLRQGVAGLASGTPQRVTRGEDEDDTQEGLGVVEQIVVLTRVPSGRNQLCPECGERDRDEDAECPADDVRQRDTGSPRRKQRTRLRRTLRRLSSGSCSWCRFLLWNVDENYNNSN